jgi:small conductance mechanosensitive channel
VAHSTGALRADPPTGATRAHWVQRLDELHLLTPLRIVAIIVVATLIAIVLRGLLTRVLSRTVALPGSDRSRADARQRALTSALRSAVLGVVWGTAVITIISELGVNIGGVIATATIIGGAIAFGAQTLIRDLISGLFVLAEDQYGVGDMVDLGMAKGQVERITLRSVRLRDPEGRVWHVAHGNVASVANLSQSAQALLHLEVSRHSDPAVVNEVANRLAEELRANPAVGPVVTGPPSPLRLIEMRDDRLVFRLTLPTVLGPHEDVDRIWKMLVLDAFRDGSLVPPLAPAAAPPA